ncbi:unnamed protein product [Protopolystoma xenopodis]|uniref:Helicase C-terminal domain-containing protein n=1 Tax=Protopolystoma xenopodis TaxID=117903 RepID=A0A448X9Z7_9PLAT|nr:unnamed protein product [Protopolystoma xenopodis]
MRNPVRVFINQNTALAQQLHQEFVRVRPQNEEHREAILASLVFRGFSKRTIVFFPTKRQAHHAHILLGLMGLSCAELHGDMTQAQRLEALRRFSQLETDKKNVASKGESNESVVQLPTIDVLLATDLAARGLDIPNVHTVSYYY